MPSVNPSGEMHMLRPSEVEAIRDTGVVPDTLKKGVKPADIGSLSQTLHDLKPGSVVLNGEGGGVYLIFTPSAAANPDSFRETVHTPKGSYSGGNGNVPIVQIVYP
jgi:hypothetical protein